MYEFYRKYQHRSEFIPIMCLNNGTPYNINFPFGTNGKSMDLGIRVLKRFRVIPRALDKIQSFLAIFMK